MGKRAKAVPGSGSSMDKLMEQRSNTWPVQRAGSSAAGSSVRQGRRRRGPAETSAERLELKEMAAVCKTLNPAIGALLQRPLTHQTLAETKGRLWAPHCLLGKIQT